MIFTNMGGEDLSAGSSTSSSNISIFEASAGVAPICPRHCRRSFSTCTPTSSPCVTRARTVHAISRRARQFGSELLPCLHFVVRCVRRRFGQRSFVDLRLRNRAVLAFKRSHVADSGRIADDSRTSIGGNGDCNLHPGAAARSRGNRALGWPPGATLWPPTSSDSVLRDRLKHRGSWRSRRGPKTQRRPNSLPGPCCSWRYPTDDDPVTDSQLRRAIIEL